VGIRVYLSPIVGTGTYANPYRAKANDLGLQYSGELVPNKPDGSPQFDCTVIAPFRATWALLDADATFERLFDIDLPDSINTWSELKAFLQSKTVGDIPALRRQALNTRLTNHGFDTSQVTLATTWWQVLRGMVQQLNNGVLPSGDGVGVAPSVAAL
jgi:hypothetical protein